MKNRGGSIKRAFWLPAFLIFVLAVFCSSKWIYAAPADNKMIGNKSALNADVTFEDGKSQAGGIIVKTVADKDRYKSGDTATLTISVENTNEYDINNLSISYNIPDNFKVNGELSESIDTLAAGETKEISVKADVEEDMNAEEIEGVISGGMIALIICAIAVVIIIVLLVFRKKSGKKVLSVFLIMSLVAAIAGNNGVAVAYAATGDYEVGYDMFQHVTVHDPSVVKDTKTGTYYIFGSHRAFAKSKDLMNWEYFSTNIHEDYNEIFKEPWNEWSATATENGALSGMMWAPDVIWNETMQKWCMYMSINGDNWVSSICLLTADDIEGPYEYKGVVVYSGFNNGKKKVDESKTDIYKVLGENADLTPYRSTGFSCINAIDPNVQYDDNGDLYMTYGSWSAGIFQLKLDKETGLRDYNTKYETERDVSDAYLGVKIAGGYYCSGEGPYILKGDDYYYLFLSYGGLEALGGYQMRVYRSENISGPYVDENGVSAIRDKSEEVKRTNYGVRIFSSYNMNGIGTVEVAQGHNSAFTDEDGRMYLVYHTRFQSETGKSEGHQVRVHQLFINDDGWLVAAPYEYSGEKLSEEGYDMEDMAGTYEFIYHEPTSVYTVVSDKQLGIINGNEIEKKVECKKSVDIGKHRSEFDFTISYMQRGVYVKLNEDGTVTGEYTGTWKNDKAKVTMKLNNGKEYKGYFLKQADETMKRNMTMTFTLEGDNVEVWGVKSLPESEENS